MGTNISSLVTKNSVLVAIITNSFLYVEDQWWLFTQTLHSSRKPYWKIFACKKRSQSILLLCCIDSHRKTSIWNCPIMHWKPLVIDYVMYMYAFVLVFWHARGPSYRAFILVSSDQTFAFCDYFLPIIIYWPLQGPLWPSTKIFWLKQCSELQNKLENPSEQPWLFTNSKCQAISFQWWGKVWKNFTIGK